MVRRSNSPIISNSIITSFLMGGDAGIFFVNVASVVVIMINENAAVIIEVGTSARASLSSLLRWQLLK